MTQIRVDIEVLRSVIRKYAEAAERVVANSREIEAAVESASGYDGQLRARVTSLASQAGPDLRAFGDHLAELTARLERIADGFEAADAVQLTGSAELAATFRTMIDRGYAADELQLWLARGQKPPWMSDQEWALLARLGEREDFIANLQRAWAEFVSSELTFNHGTRQDMLNAFRVHLFVEGFTTALPVYADWQSAADAAGLSLETYVMHVLNITPYERDTVAGVGLIETRQVGPLAMLLVGQAYYNRLFNEHWGDLEAAKSTFAGGSLDGVYYGHDWEGYTQAALNKMEPPMFTYTAEQLKIRFAGGEAADELNALASLSRAAEAAQDGSWRLIAGYRLAEDFGVEGVTFFLDDPESEWWKYNQNLIDNGFLDYSQMQDLESKYRDFYASYLKDQGLSGQQLEKAIQNRMANAIFPELQVPDNLQTALDIVESSHSNINVYEMNPDYQKFVDWKIADLRDGFFEQQVAADLAEHRPEFRAEVLSEASSMGVVISEPELESKVQELEEARKDDLDVIMPRYLYEAYGDAISGHGGDYWNSLIVLQNAKTSTAFVTFHTPDATNFFPSH